MQPAITPLERELAAFTAKAREHSGAALKALVEVMKDSKAAPTARIAAAKAVLDWAFTGAAEDAAPRPIVEAAIRWLTPEEARQNPAPPGSITKSTTVQDGPSNPIMIEHSAGP